MVKIRMIKDMPDFPKGEVGEMNNKEAAKMWVEEGYAEYVEKPKKKATISIKNSENKKKTTSNDETPIKEKKSPQNLPDNYEIFNFFEKNIYNENLGDLGKIREIFNASYKKFNAKVQILLQLYERNLSTEELKELDFSFSIKGISKFKNELKNENLVEIASKEGKKEFITISEQGQIFLKNYLNKEFVNKNDYIIKNLRLNRKENQEKKQQDPNFIKDRLNSIMDLLDNENNIEDFLQNNFFVFDIVELLELDTDLGEFIINNFDEALHLIKICLKERLPEISKIKEHTENIKIINIDKIKTQQYAINEIPKKSNEFISTKGILLRRNAQIREETKMYYYLCLNPSCPHFEDKLKHTGKLKSCPKCKSSIELIDKKLKSIIDLDIKNTENDTMIKVKAYDNLISEVCNLKIGEEILVNGHIELVNYKNQQTNTEYSNRELVLNNFKSSANSVYLTQEEEKEVQNKLEELKNNNIIIKDFLLQYMKEMYSDFPQELLDLMILPQCLSYQNYVEDFPHLLFIGSPSTYKTSILRNIKQIFPKERFLQFRQISVDKFYGGVKADGLTDVGIAMTQRDGSLIIDEIDKDTESYDKSSNMLNQVMTEQEASKERVGASIHLTNVNMRIYGVMNHNQKYLNEGKVLQWVCKNIHDSTLTRFFLIDFDSFVNESIKKSMTKKIISMEEDLTKNYDLEIRKKILIYLRKVKIDIKPIQERLEEVINSISSAVKDNDHIVRNIMQIKNIVIAVCRLKGVESATKEELDEALNLVKWSFKTQGIDIMKYSQEIEKILQEKNNYREIEHYKKELLELLDLRESISHEDLLGELGMDQEQLNKLIEKLKKEGIIYEPRKNELRRVE